MKKLSRFLKPFTLSVIAVIVLVFTQTIAELKLPDIMSEIVDVGIVKNDVNFIYRMGLFMLAVALVGGVCTVVAGYLSAKVSVGLGRNLRNSVFKHVENFSLNEFDKFGTASLITRTTNDIQQVQMVTFMILRMVISAPIMCIGGIIMAVSKDAKLSVIFLVALPVLILIITLMAKKTLPLFKELQKKLDKLNLVLRERLTGIRVIRAFNKTEYEMKRFDDRNLELTSTAIKVNRIMAGLMPIMMLILNLTTIAIIWFGGHRIEAGEMQVGDMMAFLQYAMQIMFSLIMFSMIFVMLPRASASAERINEVLETKPDIFDSADEKGSDDMKGHIEFDNVTFSYPGAEAPAIKNISFKAKPGETTAIIGGTGSGKSTLANLILRFYDIQEGKILVDGVDIRKMTQKQLRSKIGYVPQKAVIFSGTITDNIKYGKKTAEDNEISKAVDIAQASDFINERPDGLMGVVAQGGTNISGGQKQRLSIARALVRKPDIYIFDDSFSALDFRTDAKLRAALRNETKEASVIIVAQRVGTIMNADRIIVLDEGKMVGCGTHAKLMENCSVYKEIVMSQLSEEELA